MSLFAISTIDNQNNIQFIAFGLCRCESKNDHEYILEKLFENVDIKICKMIIIDECPAFISCL